MNNDVRAQRIEQKLQTEKAKRKQVRISAISASACGLATLLAFNLMLFVPYTTGGANLARYRHDEYYPVMQKVAEVACDKPYTASNFERWRQGKMTGDGWFGGEDWSEMPPMVDAPSTAPGTPDPPPGSSGQAGAGDRYEETTNNQVDGVTEGDLFKRSRDYLYYLDENYTLRIYTIAGEQSDLVGGLSLVQDNAWYTEYRSTREMYLSEDLSTVTVLTSCFKKDNSRLYTAVLTVDVTNSRTPSVKNVQYLSGSYVSSRVQDGVLLLINNFTIYRDPDFSDREQFLPHYGTDDDLKVLPLEDIYLPETVTRSNYTVLATFDEQKGTLVDAEAILSASTEAYVAKDNIFVTNGYTEMQEYTYTSWYDTDRQITHYYTRNMTDITRISYDSGMLDFGATATVEGAVKDRYSMDEYDGTFRVFSTTSPYWLPNSVEGGADYFGANASLYIMDADTLELLTSVEKFAPDGETVQSARFDGTTAYVCTAEVITFTDPVFAFDLTDITRITYKDTGTIPGYSLSLTKFTNGTLLGIGYAENTGWGDTMKIEIYGETESTVESIASFELGCNFSQKYKAYLIDRENGLVGLGILDHKSLAYEYLLLRFDGYNLVELARITVECHYDDMRAFYVDGFLYLVGNGYFNVEEI